MKIKQRGISFIGVLFVVGVFAFAGLIAAQVLPTLIEFQAITKAASKAKAGNSVAEVRAIFEKASAIDDIKSSSGKAYDLDNVWRCGLRFGLYLGLYFSLCGGGWTWMWRRSASWLKNTTA